jgi:hypothetical protein
MDLPMSEVSIILKTRVVGLICLRFAIWQMEPIHSPIVLRMSPIVRFFDLIIQTWPPNKIFPRHIATIEKMTVGGRLQLTGFVGKKKQRK